MKKVTVAEAESMYRDDPDAMRKEYTRMREIAQKRLGRLGKDFSQSRAYQTHKQGFERLRDIDPRDLPEAFSDLSKFVGAKSSTARGQQAIKRKTIQSWQNQGINLTPENYDNAIRILEEMRKRKLTYGSDKVVELADFMLEFDKDHMSEMLDNLDVFIENTDKLSSIDVDDNGLSGYSFDEVIDLLT